MNGTTTVQLAEKTAKAVIGSAAVQVQLPRTAVDLRPASGCDRLCQL